MATIANNNKDGLQFTVPIPSLVINPTVASTPRLHQSTHLCKAVLPKSSILDFFSGVSAGGPQVLYCMALGFGECIGY